MIISDSGRNKRPTALSAMLALLSWVFHCAKAICKSESILETTLLKTGACADYGAGVRVKDYTICVKHMIDPHSNPAWETIWTAKKKKGSQRRYHHQKKSNLMVSQTLLNGWTLKMLVNFSTICAVLVHVLTGKVAGASPASKCCEWLGGSINLKGCRLLGQAQLRLNRMTVKSQHFSAAAHVMRGTLEGAPERWGFPLCGCSGAVCFRKANPVTQSAICGVERETILAPTGGWQAPAAANYNLYSRKPERGESRSNDLWPFDLGKSGVCCSQQ